MAEPDFGPSLPQLIRGWWPALRRWQKALIMLALIAATIGIVAKLYKAEVEHGSYTQTPGDARARGLPPLSFAFDHSRKFKISKPAGAYVQGKVARNGVLVASMRVSPIAIEPRGSLAGFLPIEADRLERRARHTYRQFRLQFEGRSRVSLIEGYQFAFNAQLDQPGQRPRQLFGREVILPKPYDVSDPLKPYPTGKTPTSGVLITLLATSLDRPTIPQDVGDVGALLEPFRSFTFDA